LGQIDLLFVSRSSWCCSLYRIYSWLHVVYQPELFIACVPECWIMKEESTRCNGYHVILEIQKIKKSIYVSPVIACQAWVWTCCVIKQWTLYPHCSVLVDSRNGFKRDWQKQYCFFHNSTSSI